MKKKVLIAVLCVVVLAGAVLAKLFLIGDRPLKGLSQSEVSAATVELYPPDATFELTKPEIEELVRILDQVVTYQRDDTYQESCGQAVIFTLTKTDGTLLRVQAYNPFIVIDNVGYRTKYGPCEDLNHLGNDILRVQRGSLT